MKKSSLKLLISLLLSLLCLFSVALIDQTSLIVPEQSSSIGRTPIETTTKPEPTPIETTTKPEPTPKGMPTEEQNATSIEPEDSIQEQEQSVTAQKPATAAQEPGDTAQEPSIREPIDIDIYLRYNGHKGQVIFPEAEKMKVGEPKTVTAYITKNISEVINNANEEFMTKNITVTNQMNVTLTDEDGAFKITPIKEQRQYVGEKVTEWAWLVTPMESGKHTLKLNVFVVIENLETGYGENLSTYKELEQTIDVDANYVYNFQSKMEWFTGTIISLMSAIGTLGIIEILNYRKKLKEESQK